ncbi:hypothetical protein BDK61_0901 [Haloarcula quadrata]|jgi:hypothetical protein|uniref:Uncharacterized protein n=4 Tax=Haloarcula TaxID=2237 RepID=Q5V095_HALMA|nr:MULTISPECIES: hypothetical protein [Haloarcula]AAV47058.1 unknown [Haloarcula marismortui ATCC 43049]EMA14995.1 hypothetical protein C436_04420 [Haloarcula sinaiiensis ATCC 33800]EMA16533.1 hypothetical protein C435_11850 [Haloarcula californiae ATCC 33799]NHN63301.1 hypothetical protein [Haloarcula sp. JP-Z28]NHX40211.1 hypothetical protein [Haloarcula sp. R1-2]
MDDIDPDAQPSMSVHEATQKVLRTDLAIGIGGAVLGYAEAGTALFDVLPVVVGFGLLTGIAVAVVEHDAVPGVYPEVAALASFVVLAGAVAGLVTLSDAPITLVLAAVLSGFGVGVIGNRVLYGIAFDVPAYRLTQVREQS